MFGHAKVETLRVCVAVSAANCPTWWLIFIHQHPESELLIFLPCCVMHQQERSEALIQQWELEVTHFLQDTVKVSHRRHQREENITKNTNCRNWKQTLDWCCRKTQQEFACWKPLKLWPLKPMWSCDQNKQTGYWSPGHPDIGKYLDLFPICPHIFVGLKVGGGGDSHLWHH